MAHTPEEILTDIPQYKIDESLAMIAKGASRISLVSSDPDALAGLDSKKIAAFQSANGKALSEQRKATQSNKVSWVVAAAASEKWAAKVFPNLETSSEQVDALWDAIFKAVHVYDADPIATWEKKDVTLNDKAEELNKEPIYCFTLSCSWNRFNSRFTC